MTVYCKDDFTEASDTSLESHTPSGTGATGSWTLTSGSSNSGVVVGTTNVLRCNNTADTVYHCTSSGSANHYTIHRLKTLSASFPDSVVCCRFADASNYVGWRLSGAGSAGRRLTEEVSATRTDLGTNSQGVDEEWIKVEVSGSTATLYEGGTGGSPGTWNSVTSGTYTGSTTETKQGVMITDSNANPWIDDWESGDLAAAAGNPLNYGSLSLMGAGI